MRTSRGSSTALASAPHTTGKRGRASRQGEVGPRDRILWPPRFPRDRIPHTFDRMRHALVVVLFLAALTAGAQEGTVVIRAGRLLDGRGGRSVNARITVRDGRIEMVSPNATASAGSVDVTYDLSAYTVLPGLIDAHDHLAWHFNAAGKLHTASDGETPAQGALAMAANAWATWLDRRSKSAQVVGLPW